MRFLHAFPVSALACAATLALAATPQQRREELPDAPTATAEVTTVPNGPLVVMDTAMGRIICQFYQKQAPNAVANFIGLAEGTKDWTDPTTGKLQHRRPIFNGTTFHRVIPGFMVQGGDPTGTGMGGPGFRFRDEIDPNLNFDRAGRLALANSGPNTNGSQFFITEQEYPTLNGGYTLIGQCDDSSVEIVKAIARVPRDPDDKPLRPVALMKVTIVQQGSPMPPFQPGEPVRRPTAPFGPEPPTLPH